MTSGQRWSKEQIMLLERLLAENGDLSAFARSTNRTRDAVYQKAVVLGLIKTERRAPRPRVSRFTRIFG